LKRAIGFSGLPGQNVTVNLDLSTAANNGSLGAGWKGAGSLTIQDGVTVSCANGCLATPVTSEGEIAIAEEAVPRHERCGKKRNRSWRNGLWLRQGSGKSSGGGLESSATA